MGPFYNEVSVDDTFCPPLITSKLYSVTIVSDGPISQGKIIIRKQYKTDVLSYYDSDHSPIYAKIAYKNNQKTAGPGFWKFNNSLLNNEEFVTNLKFFLLQAKEKHSGTSDKRLYWEMIKMEIRDFCIRFSKRLA